MSRNSYFQLVGVLIFFIMSAFLIAGSSAMYGNICESSEYGKFNDENYYSNADKSIIILLITGLLALVISFVILRFISISRKHKSYVVATFLVLFILICVYESITSYDAAFRLYMTTASGNHCKPEIVGYSFIKYIYGLLVSIWAGSYALIKE